jgi:hypothetical protein
MNTIVPLISSGVAGPLGVLHLPRLWQKISLDCRGKLASGYPACCQGFDKMVIDALGLQRESVIYYIKSNRPTYPQFEAWIKKQSGVKLDKATIRSLNGALTGYIFDDGTRRTILTDTGVQDDANAPRDAISLNNLDDWKGFHDAELK